MLSLSHTTGYAIQALSCVHHRGGQMMLAKDIAQQARVPKPYLSKILHALSRTGLITSKRGYRGGVALARPADQITLYDIVEAVEGHSFQKRCLLGVIGCSETQTCDLHNFWKEEREKITVKLRHTTLAQWAQYKECWRREPDSSSLRSNRLATMP